MGQFEYTVGLAKPLPPEEAKKLAQEFLAKKKKEKKWLNTNTKH